MKTYKERTYDVQKKLKKRRQQRRVALTATTLAVCVLAAVLFVPYSTTPPNVSMYAGSDYYDVIQMVNEYRYTPPKYRNNFEKWSNALLDEKNCVDDVLYTPVSKPTVEEITDHQVEGVYEGDLIKRTDTHIFYLAEEKLKVYTIAGENTEMVGVWKLDTQQMILSDNEREMFLSADGKTVTLVLPFWHKNENGKRVNVVQVQNLDVSNPENITLKGSFYTEGTYSTARFVDGKLLLLSRGGIKEETDYGDPSTFVPMVGSSIEDLHPISSDKIQLPSEMNSGVYTVVTMLDGDTLDIVDAAAFLSCGSDTVYVSKERIYACRIYTKIEESGVRRICDAMTEISCMGYNEKGFTKLGTFQVEGNIKDQYSMDEYEGVLRVVTSISGYESARNTDVNYDLWSTVTIDENAKLTCFQVDTWEQVGELNNFAPQGENVQSVRFDGNYAYVCTAKIVELCDPVFFIDMTDLSNITAKDTGTIYGYSSSLVQLNNGLLLGIGYGDDGSQLKLEIYRETEKGVESVCAYTGSSWFATEYKSYYIDRENCYFGIPTTSGYVLLHFDGEKIVEAANVKISYNLLNDIRGVVIDQWLYVFGDGCEVQRLYEPEKA